MAGLAPDAAVLVATARALKYNGGVAKAALAEPNPDAVAKGCANLVKHIENLQKYGVPVVVALNKFDTDSPEELEVIRNACERHHAAFALSQVWSQGGAGGMELAEKVNSILDGRASFKYLYPDEMPVRDKIRTICREIYGASDAVFSAAAERELRRAGKLGFSKFPVCIAKTQNSLSDDPNSLGRPEGFVINVREVKISAGAGFIVAITGDIMTMPGLPAVPSAENIDVDANGNITGLF
jgi:formate--tetrahydrofolate ligase